MTRILMILAVAVPTLLGSFASGQRDTGTIPVSTQLLLDGVKNPESKDVIKAVLMIKCPKAGIKGTGFVLSGGNVVTTNSHVVGSCTAEELEGISSVSNEPLRFASMASDADRDLALLCATKPLPFVLKLGGSENPRVETEVETWGYPLRYEDPSPILSRGYIAGYRTEQRKEPKGKIRKPVQHLVVNGALNPGNSGGPLIDRATGKVIGIVVEKWTLFSPNIESVISGLEHPGAVMFGGPPIYITYPNGEVKSVTQQEAIRVALTELYEKSQVMVGEAISVSELNAFIKDTQLGCGAR